MERKIFVRKTHEKERLRAPEKLDSTSAGWEHTTTSHAVYGRVDAQRLALTKQVFQGLFTKGACWKIEFVLMHLDLFWPRRFDLPGPPICGRILTYTKEHRILKFRHHPTRFESMTGRFIVPTWLEWGWDWSEKPFSNTKKFWYWSDSTKKHNCVRFLSGSSYGHWCRI